MQWGDITSKLVTAHQSLQVGLHQIFTVTLNAIYPLLSYFILEWTQETWLNYDKDGILSHFGFMEGGFVDDYENALVRLRKRGNDYCQFGALMQRLWTVKKQHHMYSAIKNKNVYFDSRL